MKKKKLSRSRNNRQALFKSLIGALFLREKIKTTEIKAKAIRGLVDKIINRAKDNTEAARRQLLVFFQNNEIVKKAMNDLGKRFSNRPAGFTRVVKLGRRTGDAAEMVMMELVDDKIKKEEAVIPAEKPEKKKNDTNGKQKTKKH
ncbi:MAG: 50S ribosomal protein L17 [bacterium]|nr:50S ribosomal protein L17 [bacterium]